MWHLLTDPNAIPELAAWLIGFFSALVFFGTLAWYAEGADKRRVADPGDGYSGESADGSDDDLRDLWPRPRG